MIGREGTVGRYRRRVRVRVPVAGAIVLALLALSAGTTASSAAPSTHAATLPSFGQVTVASDIVYRQAVTWDNLNVDLGLDLYEGAGDTRTSRPLVIWIHGGSFAFGDKADALDVQAATSLARMGVAAASINYRMGPGVADGGIGGVGGNEVLVGAILRAMEDAREAVRWLREHASQYRIDPDRIFIAGASAGAVTALNVGYLLDRTAGNQAPTDPYRVAGVISIAGETLPTVAQAGEPEVFMAHGSSDTTVPYNEARQFCDNANGAGVPCAFETYPTDHMGMVGYFDQIMAAARAWFLGLLDRLDANPPTTTTSPASTDPPAPTSTTGAGTGGTAAPAVTAIPSFTG